MVDGELKGEVKGEVEVERDDGRGSGWGGSSGGGREVLLLKTCRPPNLQFQYLCGSAHY